MLSKTDNDYLCRIGPGTPMGNLMREYWIPAVRSDELPRTDSDPLRVLLLGEKLIAFRDTNGNVGLVQNNCPHRGASLFFGRNEECGLRCVYHGWKFDAQGNCVDMPNEPAESDFKHKVKATAYPTRERGGIIWAYMGPRQAPNLPELPDFEANMLGEGSYHISIIHRPCNWMQGWEGEMDTAHQAFLHSGATTVEQTQPGTFDYYIAKTPAPRLAVVETDFGTSYAGFRPAEEDTYYYRVAHMLFPFFAMIPTGAMGFEVRFAAYVPMDDEHTLHWEIGAQVPDPDGERPAAATRARQGGRPRELYHPNTTDWYGRFNMIQDASNNYLIDREAQRTWKSYTGIDGIRQQDMAVTESMGPIYERWKEHLGTTDSLIIKTRRRMIAAARALQEHGLTPPGVDQPEIYRQRSGGVILPRNMDWWQGSEALRTRFSAQASREPTSATA